MLCSAKIIANIVTTQKCLAVINAFLQLTAYLFVPQAEVTDKKTVDYIVVGGGSAGCVIANRLSEDPKTTVLLIEAGGVPPMESDLPGLAVYVKNTEYDWNYTAQNFDFNYVKEDYPLLTLGRVLGGTSSVNYQSYVRGAPADYDAWADLLDDDSWKYKNLLEFFKKSEHFYDIDKLSKKDREYHGTNGYMGVTKLHYNISELFLKGATEYGVGTTDDVNGHDILGYTQPMVTIAEGHRQSTAFSFLSNKFKSRSNLIIYKYTTVTKILFDKNNNAIGVEATNNGNSFTFMANKEVILSAGPFNSPQLLMLSGIGPKKHLSDMKIHCISDLPVGEGLQDHTSAVIAFNLGKVTYPKGPPNPLDFPTPAIYGAVALDSKANTPDYVAYNYLADGQKFLTFCAFSFGLTNDVCDELYKKANNGGALLLTLISLVHPKSRGSVTLNSNDPFDKPIIKVGRFAEKEDLDNFVKYIEHFVGVTNTDTFKETDGFLVYLDLPDCDAKQGSTEYWRCYANHMAYTFQSFAGTCAMGSVVDSNLYVRNVKKLRVCDLSVIPIITSGTTSSPAVMIGEKCAQLIKGGDDKDDDSDDNSDDDDDEDKHDDNDKDDSDDDDDDDDYDDDDDDYYDDDDDDDDDDHHHHHHHHHDKDDDDDD